VESDYHVQSKDHKSFWAEIEIQKLRNIMRFAFQNPKIVAKKGETGKKDMKYWTSKYCALSVIKFFKEIEK
jgi:hypothetical protein